MKKEMIYKRRSKVPRPYRIEHRAVAPALVKECPEWGKWHTYAGYPTPAVRDRELQKLKDVSTGRWEYRAADAPT